MDYLKSYKNKGRRRHYYLPLPHITNPLNNMKMLWKPVESNYCVRPTQSLQLKKTFKEAGLLTRCWFVLFLIQCLTNAFTPIKCPTAVGLKKIYEKT
jgi:hypothetical protein